MSGFWQRSVTDNAHLGFGARQDAPLTRHAAIPCGRPCIVQQTIYVGEEAANIRHSLATCIDMLAVLHTWVVWVIRRRHGSQVSMSGDQIPQIKAPPG